MEEQWKRIMINGEITKYEISTLGNVRNINNGHYLIPHLDWRGYYKYLLYHNGNKINKFLHRLVMENFVPNPNNYPQVNHINGIKTDNRIENLEWCTRSHNMQHAYDTGLLSVPKGENRYNNKYSETDILKIIKLLKTKKYKRKEIAEIVGVPEHVVKSVKDKHNWKYLTKDIEFEKHVYPNMKYYNSIDRAIISGKKRKEIMNVLMNLGLTFSAACHLYKRRKKKIKEGKSLVQNTVYIDEGIEIF